MSDQFVGEIKMFAGNFAPRGWALCQGQLMPISSNTALFSLLGTMYGGDGRVTFALPDLQGRGPMNFGQGPGLSFREQGEIGGEETVTLIASEMPFHNHLLMGSQDTASSQDPGANVLAQDTNANFYNPNPGNAVQMNQLSISETGGNEPHQNMQPYLVINYIIALTGIFPSRN